MLSSARLHPHSTSGPTCPGASAHGPQRRLSVLVTAVSLLAGACASLPPAQPIPSIDSLAGRWYGVADVGRRFVPWWVTIGPDGRLTVEYADITLWGNVTVRDGKAEYSAGHTSGELTLYGDGYQRVLDMRDTMGTLRVQMRPQ